MRKENRMILESNLGEFSGGSPGKYLDNIDISSDLDIIELLDQKRERMSSIQKDIESIESRMRAINLESSHLAGRPLSDKEKGLLSDHRRQIDIKRQQLAELRYNYQMALTRYDLVL